jgi:hypothetical protein
MIVIKHRTTGERMIVTSLNGYDLAIWEATAETVPADFKTRAYTTINGVLAPVPTPERRFTKPEFLDLWTPAETVTVMQSTDAMMAFFWARTLAWDGVFLLSDARVESGIVQALALNILTEARAARIRAGLPPQV